MLHSRLSHSPFLGSVFGIALTMSSISADEAPTSIVIENHMAMANEAGEIVAPKATNDEEAFLIRRIAEFWKDGDFRIVKMQIIEFFDKYPESALKEYFLGILGDLYLQENNPTLALEAYEQIHSDELLEKVLINKLHCYYDLNNYAALVEQGVPYMHRGSAEFAHRQHELTFLVAEGYFRQGLALEDGAPEKADLYENALSLYDSLRDTAYQEVAHFALAESHRVLGNHEEAAKLYVSLADRYPEQQDDLLFQGGNLQAQFDQEAAIQTFTHVIDRGGKRASEAMFNRLILLFKTEQYSAVLDDYEKVAGIVSAANMPTYKYIVGKSHYALEQYQEASEPLAAYISGQQEPSDQLKNALLIQMTCAQKLTDEPLYAQSLDMFQSLFPADSELPKALFLHGVMLKDNGEMQLAREKLQLIKEKFPDFESEEHFMFEYGYLAHENGEWTKAYDTFARYFETYHESENTLAAWKIYFSSALHRVDEGDESYTKASFFEDIKSVLAVEDLFSEHEAITYKLLYAKTSYELGQFEHAYEYLSALLETISPENRALHVAEAHYLSAICLYEQQKDHLAFCQHLEQAIACDPASYDKGSTHVHLFNGYLVASGLSTADESKNAKYEDKAAEHLFTAVSRDDVFIKSDNVLWLANHYYTKVKAHTEKHWTASLADNEDVASFAKRAIHLYERELFASETANLKEIDETTLSYEPEALKLADLYSMDNEQHKRLTLVTSLLEQQSTETALAWQFKKHALYELGQTYKALGNPDKALETFNYISSFTTAMPTIMSNQAAYEVASMQYKLIDAQQLNESSEAVMTVLNQLKELQIRKNALSEPYHLEAALEYTAIRAELSESEEKVDRAIFFLTRLKEDFESRTDSIGQEYHAALEAHGDKQAIYNCYMKFIDAELTRLHAEKTLARENRNEFEEASERALALLEDVKNSPNTPKELFDRTVSSIEKINTLNAY